MNIFAPTLDIDEPADDALIRTIISALENKEDPFAILSKDDMTYVQTGWTDQGYVLEFQEGSLDRHYVNGVYVGAEEVIQILQSYLSGNEEWKSSYDFYKKNMNGSKITIDSTTTYLTHEVLKDREEEEIEYVYPSKLLRTTVIIILYSVIFFVVNGLLFASLLTDNCLYNNICSGYEQVLRKAGQILWLVVTVILFVSGWRGRLWGCRRKPNDVANTG